MRMIVDPFRALKPYTRRAQNEFMKLSLRERLIVVVAVGILSLFGVSRVVGSVKEAFAIQSQQLTDLEARVQSLPGLVGHYEKRKGRRDTIKAKYKQLERKEGTLSYLERLIRDKVGTTPFINEGPSQPFGTQYEQTRFSISKVRASSLEALASLLNELVNGAQPLLVTRLQIEKPFSINRLDVELDVTSISEKGAS
jgi:hypothetical protein